MSITTPVLVPVPFCNSGTKATIPVDAPTTPDEANYASYEAGFPPITMIPTEANGIPPRGVDFNGILYALSTNIQNWNAGVQMKFNSDFCTSIGGYPLGAVLQSNDGASAYVSTIANNTTDFNSSPESIGTSWLPWAGDAAKGSSLYIAVGEGTSDAITATFDPAITELTNGLVVFVRALASNATTTPTFNPDGLGAATITKGTYQPLAVGDIAGNGYWMILQYDSTQGKWVLQNPATGIGITANTLNAQGVRTVVDSYVSQNNWWRKWSDGWLEQGGVITVSSSSSLQNLPIPFGDTNYFIVANMAYSSNVDTRGVASSSPYSTTVFYLDARSVAAKGSLQDIPCNFYACGQGA